MDREVLAAEWRLGWLYPEQVPDAATDLLAQGFDSPALRVASGLSTRGDPEEARQTFGQAMNELGWSLPTSEQAARRLIAEYARRITEGELNPDLGANDLWSLADQLDNDGETYTTLRVIAELRDQLWQVSEAERPAIERQIVSEARSLIA